jgi:membrane-associated phospholipid phosphatase
MIGVAGFTGAGRVLAGKHYPTDLLLGFGLGAFAGWGLPWLLRFRNRGDGRASPTLTADRSIKVSLLPWLGDSRLGVTLVGVF